MKPTQVKKLHLSSETIRILDGVKLEQVPGGVGPTKVMCLPPRTFTLCTTACGPGPI